MSLLLFPSQSLALNSKSKTSENFDSLYEQSLFSSSLLSKTNTLSTIFLIILHIHKFIHVFTQYTHSFRLVIRSQHQFARCTSLAKHKSTEITNTRLMKTVEFLATQITSVSINPLLVLVSCLLQHGQPRDRQNHILLRISHFQNSLREDDE